MRALLLACVLSAAPQDDEQSHVFAAALGGERSGLLLEGLEDPGALGRAAWRAQLEAAESARRKPFRPGKVLEHELTGGAFASDPVRLVFRLPRDLEEGRPYPLLLSIPDADQDVKTHLLEDWSSKEVREGSITVAVELSGEPQTWNQVAVNGRPGGIARLLTALRWATTELPVDPNRVFVCGRGASVETVLAAGEAFPHRFAGVVGRAGDAGEKIGVNFGYLPCYLAGAGPRARAFAEAAAETGADVTLEVSGDESGAWQWMSEHSRTLPTEIDVTVGEPYPVRSAWLSLSPIAPKANVRAQIDREKNSLRIDSVGAARVTVHLSDDLLDLDRPILVEANGTKGARSVTRSSALCLDRWLDGTSDSGVMYTAELVVELTGEELWPAEAKTEVPAELVARLAKAEGIEALVATAEWAQDQGLDPGLAWKRVVRLDPDHQVAREQLGHRWSRVQWFEEADVLDRFHRDQDPDGAAARGWVEYQSLWMHPEERAQLSKGREKDQESGEWLTTADRKRLSAGWVRQDLEWIEPEQVPEFEAGRWRVDGEWLSLEEADGRRSRLASPWLIPGARVRLMATTDRATALEAREHMERAIEDLRAVFGADPVLPLDVALLRNEEQFDRFAFGEPDGRRAPASLSRLHVLGGGYFAESRIANGEWSGMGVGLWDADIPYGDAYGVHSARRALGLSYVDALDPSPKAIKKGDYAKYDEEKELPAWLRFGAATYAERFFRDRHIPPGGDEWWARKWSLTNLDHQGGLGSVADVLAGMPSADDPEASRRWMLSAGALVAFLVDGEHEATDAAHGAFQEALALRRLKRSHIEALEEALLAAESAVLAFSRPEGEK